MNTTDINNITTSRMHCNILFKFESFIFSTNENKKSNMLGIKSIKIVNNMQHNINILILLYKI